MIKHEEQRFIVKTTKYCNTSCYLQINGKLILQFYNLFVYNNSIQCREKVFIWIICNGLILISKATSQCFSKVTEKSIFCDIMSFSLIMQTILKLHWKKQQKTMKTCRCICCASISSFTVSSSGKKTNIKQLKKKLEIPPVGRLTSQMICVSSADSSDQ